MTTTANKSDSLVYTTEKTKGGKTLMVTIRLNDECKNGHQDFAITGELYISGKSRIDRNMISCGCIHDSIIDFFPEFKMFIDLHLCDYKGIPMYAVENGFYHLTEGFNDVKPNEEDFKKRFCDYYRITEEQFNELSESKNKIQYALKLQSLDILTQWEIESKKAIKLLEKLTGERFLKNSTKTQYNAPTPEQITEENEKINSGYYTEEAETARELAKIEDIKNTLKMEFNIQSEDVKKEYETKLEVLNIGGTEALKNCIYYKHTKQVSFNWRTYEQISNELITLIKENAKLPDGVTIKD